MKYIYKLKFKDDSEWLTIKEQLYDIGGLLFNIHEPIQVHPMLQPEWDMETEDKPAKIPIEGYHIDIASKEDSNELTTLLNDYIVTTSNPANSWSGGGIIVLAKPTSKWLKPKIQEWLDRRRISWGQSLSKTALLELT